MNRIQFVSCNRTFISCISLNVSKMVQSLMNIIELVRVTVYFVFHIRHIMCMYVQRIWFRGKINVSNKKVFLFVFGKVQTEIFPVLIYFPKVLPFLWFLLSSLLSKIRLLFWKIGRDEKLITLDHSCSTSFITLC